MNWTNRSFVNTQDDKRKGRGQRHLIALAPLADYTDSPFCCTCRKVNNTSLISLTSPHPLPAGRQDLLRKEGINKFVIFREMVSAEAIVRKNAKTLKMCEFKPEERPIVIQIFGSNPSVMSTAVKIIVKKFKPDGIDINMGCPVPKITGKGESGAFLMKNHTRACEIVQAVKSVLPPNIPLSVKTRLGWSNPEDILVFAPKLEKAGVDLITIHGRTKVQGYSGKANWKMIAKVKKLVKIPVLANGDITPENFLECLRITKADGVMIGRGALGNPWIFGEIASSLAMTSVFQDDGAVISTNISLKEKLKTILYHAKLHEKRYGSLVSFRKHLLWYFKGDRISLPNLKQLRMQLVKIATLKDLKEIFKTYF